MERNLPEMIEVIFSVNEEDLKKCPCAGSKEYAIWNFLTHRIWIWLFRIYKEGIKRGVTEDFLIDRIIWNIEHEWIHELDSRNIKLYCFHDRDTNEAIVYLQQGERKDFSIKAMVNVLRRMRLEK